MNLKVKNNTYSSNVYLIRGDKNAIPDENTLVDVGRDPEILPFISSASTGIGKKRISQVVFTHCHYDHTSLLPEIRKLYEPKTFAFSKSMEGIDHYLSDWEKLKFGDRMFEVIHIPGHSNDSVCFFCEEDGVLFSGDTQLVNISKDNSFDELYAKKLERICRKNINVIYPGHGDPITDNCNKKIKMSLLNIKKQLWKNALPRK